MRDNDEITSNFRFKLVNTPPKNENLNQFESDLYGIIQNIELKKVKSNFQMQLSNDVKNIKKNPKLLVPAGKTNNLYELTTEEYNKLLIENISKMYKKTTLSAISSVNTEAKAIAKDLNLDESAIQSESILYYNERPQGTFSEQSEMQTDKSCKIRDRNCKQTLHPSDK